MLGLKFKFKDDKKSTILFTIIQIVTVVLIFFAIMFVKDILIKEKLAARKYLEQSVLQTASNLRGRKLSSISQLNVLSAKMLSEVNFQDDKSIEKFLASHINDYDYHKLIFSYLDGRTVKYQKDKDKISSNGWSFDKQYIDATLSGNFTADTKISYDAKGGYVSEYGVPVYDKQSRIIGVLGAQAHADTYLKILGFNNYNKEGYSYIIDKEGNFLVKPVRDISKDSNFFERNIKYFDFTKEEAFAYFTEEDNGSFMYMQNGQKYVASFAIIDSSERYVMTVVPSSVLLLHFNKLLAGLILIVVTTSILLLFLLYYNNRLLKQHEKTIYDVAFIDKITGGNNRNNFTLKARELLDKNIDKSYAMICVEITKFRALNEFYGIEDANKILMDFYNIVESNLSENSVCARDHAATFVILYQYGRQEFIAKYFVDKILDEIEAYSRDMIKCASGASGVPFNSKLALNFGIYLINDKSESVDTMYERANIAKRTIGQDVQNVCKFYDDDLRAKLLQEKAIEDEMIPALEDKQFHMYLQPKFSLKTGELAGAEALVRWVHPVKGLIPPMHFIPLFERNGFVREIDKYIWKTACEFLAERQKAGEKLFPISVNVSRVHMEDDKFIDELILLTRKYGIDAKYLELELTESACFNNEKRFEEAVHTLKRLGFVVSMDDFGTGYSSLNMLRNLPIDVLKLDRGFIKDTIQDTKGQIVTKSIIDMANKLNMVTVAEGIETEEQAEFLRNIGCQIAQGFLYGKPVDSREFMSAFVK